MVMSTSKRSYSKFLGLSDEDNLLNSSSFSINNIPRTTKQSNLQNSSFKLLKKTNINNNNCSSSAASSLLYLNKSNITSDYNDLIDSSDDENDNDYNYHSNSINKEKIASIRPNSFSFACADNNNNTSDEEHRKLINSIINENNNLLNDSNTINNNKDSIDSFDDTLNNIKNQTPKEDLIARERCFDYIVQAIDEVWARYCDTTSSAEVDMYDDWNIIKRQKISALQNNNNNNKPTRFYYNKSIHYSDNEQDDDQIFDNKSINNKSIDSSIITNQTIRDEDDDGYKTEVTEYETDSSSEYRTVSKLPDSIKLQSLKLRLTKAKNDLESVYDSRELEDSVIFWKRWDMIKYSTVELMEDDDDDDVVEDAINELEEGRFFNE